MKTVFLDFLINNSEEKVQYNDIEGLINNNILEFNNSSDYYKITLGPILNIHKENSESILDLNFILNKETNGIYFIKDMNYNMDAKVLTKELLLNKDRISINYELYLQEEFIGLFSFNIDIKE